MRPEIRRSLRAALRASDPAAAVLGCMRLEGSRLIIGRPTGKHFRRTSISLNNIRRLIVIGAGKAAPVMTGAVQRVLGSRITDGLVVTKGGHFQRISGIPVIRAGHPIPDENGRRAAARLVRLLEGLGPNDLVLFLVSGGASALLPLPAEGITLRDKQRVTAGLLRSGAAIEELNAVRKHLSRLKGGQLARICRPARVITLILSDVIGNRLDVIGSGPTAPDPTTFKDAVAILKNRRLWSRVPASVRRHLTAGTRGFRRETPKPGDPLFRKVRNVVVGDNRLAVEAVAREARAMGYHVSILTTKLQGEARKAAARFGRLARGIKTAGKPLRRPACIVAGGELTVTVKGSGKGGRCQELALSAAKEIQDIKGAVLAAFGTDGTDGPTDAAGAVADHRTIHRAKRKRLNPDWYLSRNDSYRFFKKAGGLIITGSTGTNVNDIYLLFVR